LVQLNTITKPHKANLKEDYDKIANFAKESKKNEYFLKWLKQKRSETYIYIDPLFKDVILKKVICNICGEYRARTGDLYAASVAL
jgi:hypothetical protein